MPRMPKIKGVKNKNHGRVEFRSPDGQHFIIQQRLDGLHVHVRYSRDEPRIIPFSQIVAKSKPRTDIPMSLTGHAPVVDLSDAKSCESFTEEMDCLAEDLKAVVAAVREKSATPDHFTEAANQSRKAFKLLRGVKL